MKIPKKFKLFNHIINVRLKEKLNGYHSNWGRVSHSKKEIILANDIDDDYKEQTFLHELIHLIFDYLGETDISHNEKLINNIAELLYQAIETMEYE